jgi:phospholipase C
MIYIPHLLTLARGQSRTRSRSLSRLPLVLLVLGTTSAHAQISHFQHIVFIVQENRTPDNLFQGLCNPPYGSATSCSTTPSATQYDIQTGNWLDKTSRTGVTQPTPWSLVGTFDMDHSHSKGFVALCDVNPATGICRMDGEAKTPCDPGCPMKDAQFGYVDYTTGVLDPYLSMVKQYGWANYMFQTNQGSSWSAHHFAFGGTSAPTTADDAAGIFAADTPFKSGAGCIAPATSSVEVINSSGVEFESIYPCLEHQTLPDILPPGITWRYYTNGVGGLWNAPTGIGHICESTGPGGECVGTEWTRNDDTTPSHVLSDIAACNLRSVSWVIPTGPNSDHAISNDGGGPSWVASIVNAIGTSTTCDAGTGYWKNTAIIITWDDWGGWYDHEPPPVPAAPQSGYQYGFRVPVIVISAYTRTGYIDNTRFYDFGSFIRFAEHNFGLAEGALNFADARSPTDMTAFFHLDHVPRIFKTISAPLGANFFLHDPRPSGDPDDY